MSISAEWQKVRDYNLQHDTCFPNITRDKDFPDIDPDGHFKIISYQAKYTDIKNFAMKEYDNGIGLIIEDYSGEEYEFFNEDKELSRRIFLTISKGIIKFKTKDWTYYGGSNE